MGGEDEFREEPEQVPFGAFLVVRYDTSDAGHRPVPAGDVAWLSPDIWVTGGTNHGTIIAGVPFRAHARVWNLGAFPASPTTVQFAIVDPAMGIGIDAPQVVGKVSIPHLPGLSTATVACPEELVRETVDQGHPCLLVKASAPLVDKAPKPFSVLLDRHTGQRNLSVVPAGATPMSLDLTATPVLGTPEVAQLAVAALLAPRAEDLLRPGPGALDHALAVLEELGEERSVPLERRIRSLRRAAETSPGDVRPFDVLPFLRVEGIEPGEGEGSQDPFAPVVIGTLPALRQGEPQRVHVDIDVGDVGEEVAVQVWQIEDGVATGGYTALVTRQDAIEQPVV